MCLRSRPALLIPLLVASLAQAAPPRQHAHEKAMALGHAALDAYLQRDFATASRLYLQAADLEPDVAEFRFAAARTELEAGHAAAARALFAQVAAMTEPDSPLHAKALLAARTPDVQPPAPPQLPPAGPPAMATPSAAPEPPVVAPPVSAAVPAPIVAHEAPPPIPARTSDWHKATGWSAAGVGLAATAVATGLAIAAAQSQATLDGYRTADGHYDGARISYTDALANQSSINARWTSAGVAGGVGVAALLLAGWWLLRQDRPEPMISWAPTGGFAAP